MKTKKSLLKSLENNVVYVVDEKNGVKCEYNNDSNKVKCYVMEDKGLDDTIVSDVIENFWDSQPEYYRAEYNILL
ncbi:MAG: hypothetical protein ACOC34_04960 [Thermotogota bacterium]